MAGSRYTVKALITDGDSAQLSWKRPREIHCICCICDRCHVVSTSLARMQYRRSGGNG